VAASQHAYGYNGAALWRWRQRVALWLIAAKKASSWLA